MIVSMTAPAIKVCAFALGCALIHSARRHAEAVSIILMGVAFVAGLMLVLAASAETAPDPDMAQDAYTAFSGL